LKENVLIVLEFLVNFYSLSTWKDYVHKIHSHLRNKNGKRLEGNIANG
jgi:hypothetical protein